MDSQQPKSSSSQEPLDKSKCDFFTPQRLLAVKEAIDHKFLSEIYKGGKEEEAGEKHQKFCIICKAPTFHKCFSCQCYYCWTDWKKHEGNCRSRHFKSKLGEPHSGSMISKNSSPFSKFTRQFRRTPMGVSGHPFVKRSEMISNTFLSKFRSEEENKRHQDRMLWLNDNDSQSKGDRSSDKNNKDAKFPPDSSSPETEYGTYKFFKEHCKYKPKYSKRKPKIKDVILKNPETKTVVFTYKEPDTQIHWVMEEGDVEEFETIQNTLAKECDDYECIKPEVGIICGCKYSNEWYRARVIALYPIVRVHYVDFGNTSEVISCPLKKLPPEIILVKNLVYSVKFDESVSNRYKKNDITGRKLKITALRITAGGVEVVSVIPEESETEEKDTSLTVMSMIKSDSKGEISFLPGDDGDYGDYGDSTLRYGLIIPEDCKEAIEADIKDLKSLESNKFCLVNAAEGDYVLVSYRDQVRRGKVMCMLGCSYYVLLIDYGIVIGTESVGQIPGERKDLVHLGVTVFIYDILSYEKMKNEKFLYQVTGEVEPKNRWPFDLKDTSSGEVVAKGYIQSQRTEGITVPLCMPFAHGSLCEMTMMTGVKTCYVRSLDEQTARKGLEMAVKMTEALAKVDPLSKPPDFGKMYAAKIEKDCCFYRVIVKSVKKKRFEVFLVDYGTVEIVTLRCLKPLPFNIKVVPFFAMEVTLSGIIVGKLSDGAKQYVDKLIEKNSTLILTYSEDESDEVILQEKNSGVIVNEFIVSSLANKEEIDKIKEEYEKADEGQNDQEGEKDKKDGKDLKDQKEQKKEAGEKDKKDEEGEKDLKDQKEQKNKAGEKDEEGDEGKKKEVGDEGNVDDNNDHGVRSPAEGTNGYVSVMRQSLSKISTLLR